MYITKHKDMRFALVENRYIKKIEIIGNELYKLIGNLETDKNNDISREDVIRQLEEIKNFTDSL